MQVVFDSGILLPELDLWLDSRRKRESSLISHAHSDHTGRHLKPVVTPNTLLLLSDYLKNASPVVLPYGETMDTPGLFPDPPSRRTLSGLGSSAHRVQGHRRKAALHRRYQAPLQPHQRTSGNGPSGYSGHRVDVRAAGLCVSVSRAGAGDGLPYSAGLARPGRAPGGTGLEAG